MGDSVNERRRSRAERQRHSITEEEGKTVTKRQVHIQINEAGDVIEQPFFPATYRQTNEEEDEENIIDDSDPIGSFMAPATHRP